MKKKKNKAMKKKKINRIAYNNVFKNLIHNHRSFLC